MFPQQNKMDSVRATLNPSSDKPKRSQRLKIRRVMGSTWKPIRTTLSVWADIPSMPKRRSKNGHGQCSKPYQDHTSRPDRHWRKGAVRKVMVSVINVRKW